MNLFNSIENYKNNIALVSQSTKSITYEQLVIKININILKEICPILSNSLLLNLEALLNA